MKTTFTPGPYSLSGITGDNHIMAGYHFGGGRKTVAIVPGWPGIKPEEHEANKRLFQAAPDLLEALVGLYRIVGTRCSTEDAEAMLIQGEALKAIRKAKGGV